MSRVNRLNIVVAAVAVTGVLCLAGAARLVPAGVALAYFAAFVVAELTSSRLRDNVRVSLSNLVVLVALLDQGWPMAVVAAGGGLVAVAVQILRLPREQRDQAWLRYAFNCGQFIAAAAAAAATYRLVTEPAAAAFPEAVTILGVTLAAMVYVVSNNLLVGIVVALSSGEPVRSALRSVLSVGWLQGPYVGLSILAAALLRAESVGPLLLLLLVLPVLVARSGLQAFQRTDEAYDRLVRAFVTAIEVKDPYTRGHSERVATLAVHVAEELGVDYDERRLVGYAAMLHDVGKIGVPRAVLNKPGPLDDDEFAQIAQHPTVGAEILRDIDFLEPALDVVRCHHERLDGAGYPNGLGGDDLAEPVRIVTAVDAFDAMTSTRSYRRARSVEAAIAELHRCVDTQFDAEVVAAVEQVVRRLDWQPTVEFASEELAAPLRPTP